MQIDFGHLRPKFKHLYIKATLLSFLTIQDVMLQLWRDRIYFWTFIIEYIAILFICHYDRQFSEKGIGYDYIIYIYCGRLVI